MTIVLVILAAMTVFNTVFIFYIARNLKIFDERMDLMSSRSDIISDRMDLKMEKRIIQRPVIDEDLLPPRHYS